MKVVILAGGKGFRYESDVPKSLAMIGNKSILLHIMDIYFNQGYNDFILCLGHKKEKIIEHFNNIRHGYNIKFIDTGEDSNTAHRIKLIEKHIPKEDEHFFVTYSDGLANIDLDMLYRQHKKLDSIATMTIVRPNHQYGLVKTDILGRVIEFIEKPRMKEYVSAGFMIFKNNIFDHISSNNKDLEIDILPRLSYEGKLGAYKHERFWATINTIKDQINLDNLYKECMVQNKELPWRSLK